MVKLLRCHCIVLQTQTYDDNVYQFIYLQKLAVLPFKNVKSHVYLNKSCMATFCRRGYGLKENDSSIYFCRITIPAFHADDLKGVTTTELHF